MIHVGSPSGLGRGIMVVVMRAYKFPLRPTAAQRVTFERWLGQCCELYNAALEQRIMWWRRAKKSLTYNDQCKQLASGCSLGNLVGRTADARRRSRWPACTSAWRTDAATSI